MRNNYMETDNSMGHEGSHVDPGLELDRGMQRQTGADSQSTGGPQGFGNSSNKNLVNVDDKAALKKLIGASFHGTPSTKFGTKGV